MAVVCGSCPKMGSDPVFRIIGNAMNLLMIIIILFAILVSVSISYIAWEISAGKPSSRKIKEPGEVKEPKDLPDS